MQAHLVRVYSTRKNHYRDLVGCLLSDGRPLRLDYTNSGNDAGDGGWFATPAIDIHGTLVGWANTTNGDAGGQSLSVHIQDLRHRRPINDQTFVRVFDGAGAVGSLRVISDRALAWIVCSADSHSRLNSQRGCAPPARNVYNIVDVYDANNRAGSLPVEVGAGAHVDARSLRRRGDTITWHHGRTRESATLRP